MFTGGNGIIHDIRMSDKNHNAAFGEFAVKKFDRNDDFIRSRIFPEFMFALTEDEAEELVTNRYRFGSMRHSSVLTRIFGKLGVTMVATLTLNEGGSSSPARNLTGSAVEYGAGSNYYERMQLGMSNDRQRH